MKTQSQQINKNHWFLECSRACGDWDFRFYSYPNLHLTRFSFCLENDEKWGPRGLEILWKPIMSTKSFPKEEKNRQGCPKKPPGRLYGAPRWAQNAPKTSPGRLQDGFKLLLERGCFLYRLLDLKKYPQMVSKSASRRLKNAPMRGAT